jgi:hypothetical protein
MGMTVSVRMRRLATGQCRRHVPGSNTIARFQYDRKSASETPRTIRVNQQSGKTTRAVTTRRHHDDQTTIASGWREVSTRHCERSEANSFSGGTPSLLRFARNDRGQRIKPKRPCSEARRQHEV